MTYKITWREQDESGWFVQRRTFTETPDGVRVVIEDLWDREIYECCVKRVHR
ncbi:MAG: hypothetical protein JSV86_10390 [Gemmatimonadota bacterium]|nr:MAG: hypothetical protein JSV86_10390 [Gemmatimonadota bacterium]